MLVPPPGMTSPASVTRCGNVTEALIAAKALPHVGLVSRWSSSCPCATRTKSGSPGQPSAGRAGTARRRQQGLEEAQAVLAAFAALRGPLRRAAAAALSDLIHQRGLDY